MCVHIIDHSDTALHYSYYIKTPIGAFKLDPDNPWFTIGVVAFILISEWFGGLSAGKFKNIYLCACSPQYANIQVQSYNTSSCID